MRKMNPSNLSAPYYCYSQFLFRFHAISPAGLRKSTVASTLLEADTPSRGASSPHANSARLKCRKPLPTRTEPGIRKGSAASQTPPRPAPTDRVAEAPQRARGRRTSALESQRERRGSAARAAQRRQLP